MNAIPVDEKQILHALHRVPTTRWPDVLDFISHLGSPASERVDIEALATATWTADALQLLPEAVQNAVSSAQAKWLVEGSSSKPTSTWWRARELVKLPLEQRGIILEASATVAAKEYETDPELTAFDAFGEDDLYVDSSDTETR